jgi:hypothetical protein
MESRFKEPTVLESVTEVDYKHAIKYEGDLNGLRMIHAMEALPKWNKHLPVPLTPNEPVHMHGSQDGINDVSYVRVIHGADVKVVSVFSRQMFTELMEDKARETEKLKTMFPDGIVPEHGTYTHTRESEDNTD